MKLTYTPKDGFVGPPIPWPADDHYEDDHDLAKAKVRSAFFAPVSRRDAKALAEEIAADIAAEEAAEPPEAEAELEAEPEVEIPTEAQDGDKTEGGDA